MKSMTILNNGNGKNPKKVNHGIHRNHDAPNEFSPQNMPNNGFLQPKEYGLCLQIYLVQGKFTENPWVCHELLQEKPS